jgi:hypothetical protein
MKYRTAGLAERFVTYVDRLERKDDEIFKIDA